MSTRISPIATLALVVSIIIGGGCSRERPEDVLETGPSASVTNVDDGQAGTTAGMQDLRVLPVTDWPKPDVPLVRGPDVISIWIYPRASADGLTYREGVWVHRILRTFTWGMDLMKRDSLRLVDATNPDGKPMTVTDRAPMALPPSFVAGWKGFGERRQRPAAVPWVQPQAQSATPQGR